MLKTLYKNSSLPNNFKFTISYALEVIIVQHIWVVNGMLLHIPNHPQSPIQIQLLIIYKYSTMFKLSFHKHTRWIVILSSKTQAVKWNISVKAACKVCHCPSAFSGDPASPPYTPPLDQASLPCSPTYLSVFISHPCPSCSSYTDSRCSSNTPSTFSL